MVSKDVTSSLYCNPTFIRNIMVKIVYTHVYCCKFIMKGDVKEAPIRISAKYQKLINDTLIYLPFFIYLKYFVRSSMISGRRGRDCKVVGFTTTCAISAYHH